MIKQMPKKFSNLIPLILVIFLFLISAQKIKATVYPPPAGQGSPFAAYNPGNNQFLIVWGECRNIPTLAPGQKGCHAYGSVYNPYSCGYGSTNASDIYGQIINGDGTCFGGNFLISREPAGQRSTGQELPAVAYNPDYHEYFVVWQGHRRDFVALEDQCEGAFQQEGYDIFGQRVSAGGIFIGPPIRISKLEGGNPPTDKDDHQWHPRVAYSTADHVYMVVWHDGRTRQLFPQDPISTFKDIYGQIIKADGTLIGNNFPVSIDPNNTIYKIYGNAKRIQEYADIVYDSDRNRFMVVFEDDRDGTGNSHPCSQQYDRLNLNIYGSFFDTSGRKLGNNFPISTAPNTAERYPEVAYDPVQKQFLVVWQSAQQATAVQPPCPPAAQLPAYPNDWIKVLAQRIDQDGNKVGSVITIENAARLHNKYCHNEMAPEADVAFDTINNKYLVTWGVTSDPTGAAYRFETFRALINPNPQDNTFTKTSNNASGIFNRIFFKTGSPPSPLFIFSQWMSGKEGITYKLGTEGAPFNCPADGGPPPTTPYPTPTTQPPTPTPTCDRLGEATIEKFNLWKNEFNNPSVNPATSGANFNCDDKVNLKDFEIWRENFNL